MSLQLTTQTTVHYFVLWLCAVNSTLHYSYSVPHFGSIEGAEYHWHIQCWLNAVFSILIQ